MKHKAFELLCKPVKNVVTGVKGICDSICFDLYGSVQACIRPDGLTDKGEVKPTHWYDIKRLFATGAAVMPVPDFSQDEIGPADKPSR